MPDRELEYFEDDSVKYSCSMKQSYWTFQGNQLPHNVDIRGQSIFIFQVKIFNQGYYECVGVHHTKGFSRTRVFLTVIGDCIVNYVSHVVTGYVINDKECAIQFNGSRMFLESYLGHERFKSIICFLTFLSHVTS